VRIARECPCCGGQRLLSSPAVVMPFVADRALGWPPATIDQSWGLRTIPSGRAYTICNSLQCKDCRFLFSDIRFDDTELQALYRDYRGDEYVALRERYEPGYAERNRGFSAEVPWLRESERFVGEQLRTGSPRVLDFGGDTGINTPFRSTASLCHIYDISDVETLDGVKSVTYAEARATEYDLLISTQVLEHVPEPLDVMVEMRDCMSPDTLLFLELPHEALMKEHSDSLTAVTAKRHWHEHINFYSLDALDALATTAGLRLVARHEFGAPGSESNILQSVLALGA
jgi:hypothetical protein